MKLLELKLVSGIVLSIISSIINYDNNVKAIRTMVNNTDMNDVFRAFLLIIGQANNNNDEYKDILTSFLHMCMCI